MPESDPPPLSSSEPEELLFLGGSAMPSSLLPSSLSPSLPSSLDELSYLTAGGGRGERGVCGFVMKSSEGVSGYPHFPDKETEACHDRAASKRQS